MKDAFHPVNTGERQAREAAQDDSGRELHVPQRGSPGITVVEFVALITAASLSSCLVRDVGHVLVKVTTRVAWP
jgi:hypothetical protein